MTSGQKVAFSLLISVLAFCAFTVVAFSGLFDLLEVNFYQPVVQQIKEKKIGEIAAAQNEYFNILMKRFDSFILSDEVKTYADTRPSDSDVKKRELRRSQLAEATSSLKGIRIIAENGRNVYFSTFSPDIISGKKGITYKNYDGMDEISYESLSSGKSLKINDSFEKKCRLIKDGDRGLLIFSIPFFNSKDEFSGTALFYCDSVGFSQFLLNRNLIDVSGFARLVTTSRNEKTKFLDNFGGFVFGMPNFGQDSLKNQILEKWRSTGDEKFWKVIPEENPEIAKETSEKALPAPKENLLCVFSHKAERGDFGFISFMYDESELKFPPYMRILLLVTAFVTLYLAVFLILSFKHDDIVVIRDKVRRYENEFFIGYKKMGEAKSPAYLAEQKPVLERRILKSLGRKGEKHASEFKSIFEGYWNEMLSSFGDNHMPAAALASAAPMINADELKEIVRSSLEDILENGKIQINATGVKEAVKEGKAGNSGPEAEPVEDVVPVEEAVPAEEVEDVEETETAEEVEDVPEAEDGDSLEDAESLEDVEPVEETEALEEVEDAEPVEEIAPVEELESFEEPLPALDEVAERPAFESESAVSEELEPITDLDEELKFGDGRIENSDDPKPEFHTVTKEHLALKFDEELEMLPEVSEREELAIDIARTLAALPEQAPCWEDNENDELDSEGLTRKPSYSELHDIQKLKDVAKVIDEKDAELEELEVFDPEKQNANQKIVDTDYYAPHIMDNNIRPDDDIYKDEVLLEKIEFGVPTTEILQDVTDDSIADNFSAVKLDYSFLDDDDLDEKLYGVQSQQEPVESDHFFTNTDVKETEKKLNEAEEPEQIESAEEVKFFEEDTLATPDDADNIEEAEELESLDEPEENMPFMFTKFAAATNADLPELSLDTDDAIVQDNDGTFRVTKWSQPDGRLPLDMDFKRLVDSIMR